MSAEYRKNLNSLVKAFLFGPLCGENETIPLNPIEFYSTGLLFPEWYIGSGKIMKSGQPNDIEFDDVEISDNLSEDVTYTQERPAHFRSIIGLSFRVKKKSGVALSFELNYNKYKKEEDLTGKKYTCDGVRLNFNLSLDELITDLNNFENLNSRIPDLDPNLVITKLVIKHGDDDFLISIRIQNQSKSHTLESRKKVSRDELLPYVYFRTKLKVITTDCFQAISKSLFSFDNDPYFESLFKNRLTFCSGLNISSHSKVSETDNICNVIKTEYIPESIQRELKTDISGLDENIVQDALNIDKLISDPDKIIEKIQPIIDHYLQWINKLSLPEARKKCLNVLKRLHKGIDYLRTEKVRMCFIDTLIALNEQFKWGAGSEGITLRPFQLAFFLMVLPELVDPVEESSIDIVDLLWIPTGGGKTEAYLAVSGFVILWNRLGNQNEENRGISVLSRYTLRLLTSQQFQRTSKMILALELLRKSKMKGNDYVYGRKPISIGIFVGGASTPNNSDEYKTMLTNWQQDDPHPFPLDKCPKCNTPLINKSRNISNFREPNNSFFYKIPSTSLEGEDPLGFNSKIKFNLICCQSNTCKTDFAYLPIFFIDDDIFEVKPDFLLTTVDKLAMTHFGSRKDKFKDLFNPPPKLILQDELHLINGALGTIFANYEAGFESLWQANGSQKLPKVITSTATPKNSEDQIRFLFGRESRVFPPGGDSIEDFFFSRFEKSDTGRLYVGYMASGMPEKNFERDISSAILASRIILSDLKFQKLTENQKIIFTQNDPTSELSKNTKTMVAYFNALRELGGYTAMVGDDIRESTTKYLNRFRNLYEYLPDDIKYNFNERISEHIEESENASIGEYETKEAELTSRKLVSEIQEVLNIYKDNDSNKYPDIISATNMISVGIDIPQFNTMLVCGQPKSVSEYIQSSSRVGRNSPGIVFVSHNPNKLRDSNYYQFFESFHKSFYKYSDPTTVSPYSLQALRRSVPAQLITFMEIKFPDITKLPRRDGDASKEEFLQFVNEFCRNLNGESWDHLDLFINNQNQRFNMLNEENFSREDRDIFRENLLLVIKETLSKIEKIVNRNDIISLAFTKWVYLKMKFNTTDNLSELNEGRMHSIGVDYGGYFLLNEEAKKRSCPILTSMRNVDSSINLSIGI